MNVLNIPFLSQVYQFSNTDKYIEEITEQLIILVPILEDYLNKKFTEDKMVCKSFISHLTRLIERFYYDGLPEGEQENMKMEIKSVFDKHRENIQKIFDSVFPNIELPPIEIYYLVLYFLRFEREMNTLTS